MEFWSETIDGLWHLGRAYQQGALTVFAGAGLSRSCGLPLWNHLVRDMHVEVARRSFPAGMGSYDQPTGWGGLVVALAAKKHQILEDVHLPLQSRLCKRQLGDQYTATVQRVLYGRPYQASETVRALVGLTGLRSICTYNYDDLVEITGAKGAFLPVAGPEDPNEPGVPVYHVHGFMPSDLALPPRGDLVFSEDEYHAMYANFSHWSNLVQLTELMAAKCVLFVGLSFEDPNLRRIIDIARGARKNLRMFNAIKLPQKRPHHHVDPLMELPIRLDITNALFRDIGVTNLWIDDYEPDLPILLRAIGAVDPVESYTRNWRAALQDRYEALPKSGPCGRRGCTDAAAEGYDLCPAHLLGDGSTFSDHAPMPKTLRDVCSHAGCERISAGLAGVCIEHLSASVSRSP